MGSAFQLDADGDLDRVNGRLVRVDSVAQRLTCALRLLRGEWFLDRGRGVPWIDRVVGQRTNIAGLRSLLRETALAVDGVTSVDRIDITINSRLRTAEIAVFFNGGEVVNL